MTLSVTANFTNAFITPKTVEVRFHLEIWTSAGTSNEWTDGLSEITAAQPTMAYVAAVSTQLDPVQRSGGGTAQLDIHLHDDPFNRGFLVDYPLLGTYAVVKIGTRELAEGDYAAYFAGRVAEAVRKNGYILIRLKTFDDALKRQTAQVPIVGLHPLEALEDYCGVLESAQYDATSLDPSDSDYATISHFVVCRGNYWMPTEQYDNSVEVNLRSVVDEICQMLHGSFMALEDGVLTFRLFDGTASVAASWDDEDIDEIELVSALSDVINKISIRCFKGQLNAGAYITQEDYSLVCRRGDTASQALFQFATAGAATDVIDELVLTNNWLKGGSNAFSLSGAANNEYGLSPDWTAGNPAVSDTITIFVHPYAFCGNRYPSFPGASQPNWAKAGATKPVYLQYDTEIIRCESVVPSINDICGPQQGDPAWTDFPSNAFTTLSNPMKAEFTVSARGDLGSSAAAHTSDFAQKPIFDVTIPMWTATKLLDRFSNGKQVLRVTTSLAQYAVQVGDLVDITTDRVSFYDHSTLSSVTKWEVTEKVVDVYSSPPRISWTLVFAADSGLPSVTDDYECVVRWPVQGVSGFESQGAAQQGSQYYIQTGFGLTNTNLSVTIGKGKIYGPGGVYTLYADITFTADAEADTLISFDVKAKGIIQHKLDIDATAETYVTATDVEIPLWRITTDTLTVVKETDLRRTEPVPGSIVQQTTLGTQQMSPDQFYADGIPNGAFSVHTRDTDTYPPDTWTMMRLAKTTDEEYYRSVSLVDSDTHTFSAANPVADTLSFTPSTPTTNNDGGLILAMASQEAETISSITQTNVSWDQIGYKTDTNRTIHLWRGIFTGGAPSTSISVATSGNVTGAWVIAEFDHITTGATGSSTASDSGVTAETTSALATTNTKELFVAGVCQDDNAGTFDWQLGFTEVDEESGAATQTVSLAFREMPSGTYNAEASLDGSDDWALALARVPLFAAAFPFNLIEDTSLWASSETTSKWYKGTTTDTGSAIVSAKLNTIGNDYDKLFLRSAITPVRPDRTMEMFYKYKKYDTTPSSLQPTALWYDSTKTLTGASGSETYPAVAAGAWVDSKLYAVPGAGNTHGAMLIGAYNSSAVAARIIDFDRVKLTLYNVEVNAYATSTYLITTGATWKKAKLDAESRDPASVFDTSTWQFTVPYDGYYAFAAQIEYSALNNAAYAELRIYNTTTTTAIVTSQRVYNNTGGAAVVRCNVMTFAIAMSSGDVIEMQTRHSAAGSMTQNSGADVSFFTVVQPQGE